MLVHRGDIAGQQPTIAQDVLGCIGLLPVTAHHLRAAHAQFAASARGDFAAAGAAQLNIGGGQRQPHAAIEFAKIDRVDADQRRGFSQLIAFQQRDSSQGPPPLRHRLLDRCTPTDGQLEGPEIQIPEFFILHQGIE